MKRFLTIGFLFFLSTGLHAMNNFKSIETALPFLEEDFHFRALDASLGRLDRVTAASGELLADHAAYCSNASYVASYQVESPFSLVDAIISNNYDAVLQAFEHGEIVNDYIIDIVLSHTADTRIVMAIAMDRSCKASYRQRLKSTFPAIQELLR